MAIPVKRPNNEAPRPQGTPRQEPTGLPSLEEELVLPQDYEVHSSREERIPPQYTAPEPTGNLFDDEDDDTFTSISADDDSLYEDEDDWEEPAPVKPTRPQKPVRPQQPQKSVLDEIEEEEATQAPAAKKRFGRKEKRPVKPGYTEDTFIDEKNEKLKPFGRRAAKVSDFDTRKNRKKNAKLVQMAVIFFLMALVGLGLKNAFFPPATLSESEVVGIIQAETGTYGFPVDRGAAFAKDFMQAYLTVNNTDPAIKALNEETLAYFYSGSSKGSAMDRSISNMANQKILYGPTVYDKKELTAYSASYTIGALVQFAPQGSTPPTDASSAKWAFFNVNVYYDSKTDGFYITPTSPTVIPKLEVKPASSLPMGAKLGNGTADTATTEKIRSVVYGFVDGYSKSSPSDHAAIDQYILPNPEASLLKGLDNRYKLAGSPENAIKYDAYLTDDPATVKVALTVTWREGTNDVFMDYPSTYVMTLTKQSNGTYLVSKFAPEFYIQDKPAE